MRSVISAIMLLMTVKKCLPWNFGPELCAAKVQDHSLFYIDECIDPRVSKEKVSRVIISLLRGEVSTKQMIKLEFMNLVGSDVWRWNVGPLLRESL